MAKKGLNLDIKKKVLEFESFAKKINLNVDKKRDYFPKKEKTKVAMNKKIVKNLSLIEHQLLLKKWKRIFNGFLIFSIFMFIIIIFIFSSYYKTQFQEEEIIFEDKDYISGSIHFESRLNNSFFYLANLSGDYERNIQNFIISKDEECIPNVLCKYIGYTQEYDLSTLVNNDFLLDKNVISCYDSSNCISNFTYLKSSEESFSKQKVRIEKDGEDTLKIYDEDNALVAKLEKKDLGGIEGLYIWFK